jgi:DNA topoisomerase VI subunit B
LASNYLTITIADNGPGIKELNIENILIDSIPLEKIMKKLSLRIQG